ncbi:flippase-like domain-containing protein [bacterium]|nr:flippase-like domain-containing protein [candidate division CSSED10-310 bacterium]
MANEMQGLSRRKILIFTAKIAVSIAILWVVFSYLGSAQTRIILRRARPGWIGMGALFIVSVQVVKAWRFRELGRVLNQPIPFYRCLLAHLIVPILGFITPGKLGEGFKIVFLQASRKELGFLFIIERIQDLLMLLAVAGFGFAFSDFYIITYLVMAGIVAAGILVFLRLEWVMNALTRRLFKREYFSDKWFLERSKKLLTITFIIPCLLTVLVWTVTFASSYCFAKSVDIPLSYPKIALVFSWAVIMGLLSSLPGGVGVREGGITVLLETLYAVPRPLGAAVAAINLGMHYITLTVTALVAYTLHQRTGRPSADD